MPLIRKLWHISEQLSYEQAVREVLKVEPGEVRFCSFVISVATVFAIFAAVVFDQHPLLRLAYTPQAIRMDRLMLNAMTWCNQNRPALGSVIKPEWFRRILFASLQNAADDWSGQVLRLPLNEVYFSQLNAELVQLLERK